MSIIVNFCPTGMVPTKSMTPYVPESPAEVIEQTHEAYEIGITIAHLHARDEEGAPTWKKDVYAKIFEGVRKHCPDLLICGSTSGRNFPEFEKRSAVIELQPDFASLTLSSLNFVRNASVNPPNMIASLLAKMADYGVHPELECFDLGMINYGKYLLRKQETKPPFYWNILFGNIAGMQATLSAMAAALNEIPDDHYVAFAGLGNSQLPAISTAISHGLGVRIGIEDNIWLDRNRTQFAKNVDLVKRVHEFIEMHEQTFMSAVELGAKGFYNTKRVKVKQ